MWKLLFGRTADGIEQSIDDDDEYRIIDQTPVTNIFINSGGDDKAKAGARGPDANYGPNPANFLAGIIEGVLNSSKMYCKCSAHFVPEEDQQEADSPSGKPKLQTLYVIKFDKEVTRRE